MCVLSGDHKPTAYSTRELELFFGEPSFLIFELVTFLILAYLVLIHVLYRHVTNRKEITELFLLGYGPAWLGAIMNMMLKASMEILKSSIKGESRFVSIETFLSVTVTVLLAVAQILFVNRGLKKFEHRTIKFIGFYQALMMMLGVTTGGVFYGEFDVLPQTLVVFLHRCFFATWGLLILSFVDTRTHVIDMPTRKYCLAIPDLYGIGCNNRRIPSRRGKETRKKGFLSTYDDTL